MEDNIKKLYWQINKISVGFLFKQERNNIDLVKEIIPQIQEFVIWFLNRKEAKEEAYSEFGDNLIFILEDILKALEQKDRVLMHDAITYGLKEYLLLFLQEEEKLDDNI